MPRSETRTVDISGGYNGSTNRPPQNGDDAGRTATRLQKVIESGDEGSTAGGSSRDLRPKLRLRSLLRASQGGVGGGGFDAFNKNPGVWLKQSCIARGVELSSVPPSGARAPARWIILFDDVPARPFSAPQEIYGGDVINAIHLCTI